MNIQIRYINDRANKGFWFLWYGYMKIYPTQQEAEQALAALLAK